MAISTLRHPGRQATCARRVWQARFGVGTARLARVATPTGAMKAVAGSAASTIDPTGTNDGPTTRNHSPRST